MCVRARCDTIDTYPTPNFTKGRTQAVRSRLAMALPSDVQRPAHCFGMLLPDVLAVRGVEKKILDSVVGLVAVEMVDAFASSQEPPEMPFHDPPMFHHRDAILKDTPVSSRRQKALAGIPSWVWALTEGCKVTGKRTVFSRCPYLSTDSANDLPAVLAGDFAPDGRCSYRLRIDSLRHTTYCTPLDALGQGVAG